MRALLRAISFLTIIPVGKELEGESKREISRSMAWFPLVGLIPGALGFAIASLSPRPLPASVAAFLALLAGVVITGGLHLDGLADWADGLAGRSPEEILRIMKDTQVGAFGVSALALLLLGKYAAMLSIITSRHGLMVLLLAPVLARWTLTLVAGTSPYPRVEGGTGRAFVGQGGWKTIIQATAAMILVVLLAGDLKAGVYALIAGGAALLIRRHSMRRVAGVTGDILGATCEIVELAVLLAAAAASR